VREKLAKNNLVISPEQYIWREKEPEFFGDILTAEGMKMAEDMIQAI
jgi:hypothetical protein